MALFWFVLLSMVSPCKRMSPPRYRGSILCFKIVRYYAVITKPWIQDSRNFNLNFIWNSCFWVFPAFAFTRTLAAPNSLRFHVESKLAFLIPAAQYLVYKNFFSCKQNSELLILPTEIEIRFLTGSLGVYDGYSESYRKEGAVITHPSHSGVCLH